MFTRNETNKQTKKKINSAKSIHAAMHDNFVLWRGKGGIRERNK